MYYPFYLLIFLQDNFQKMKKILKRAKRRTPKFFKQVRTIGVALAGVSAAVLAAPVALPAVLIKVAGYLAVAGAVAGSVSQTAVTNERN
ncbi:hypothetical protein IQ13_1357 [Lacibacter cauensis]|uniref:Uncharacterized protein n=2 Tax=Lacibacter cauensis TaxID=510947 RepID=A0A562SPP7_9BACT|nr:hypothetical protein IQ13_1357 [Lacibacter cauensis]